MLNSPFLSHERQPVPTTLLSAAIILCGLVPFLLALKTGAQIGSLTYATALVASALMFIGWRLSPSFPGATGQNRNWMLFAFASVVAAVIGPVMEQRATALHIVFIALPGVLLFLHGHAEHEQKSLKHVLVPLLVGSIFLFVSSALGTPKVGAFPAVIGALFVAVLRATLDIEEDVLRNHGGSDRVAVEHHYRHRLAVTAVIFFLFGTVSLWPWLGEMYGAGYFWIMLFGVLLPLAFFWGRIRQPKLEGARVALIRFNRIAPILGVLHIIAVAAS